LIRILLVIVTALCCLWARAQTVDLSQAKQLFDQERWPELARFLEHAPRDSADLDYYYGMALAHLERWDEARQALLKGEQLAPRDKRFPIELAGVAFKRKKTAEARRYLHRALRLDSADVYANDFAATLYFLDGNVEAALKYWNRAGKPEIAEVRSEPALRVRPALLDHAFAFAPASLLTLDQLLATEARVQMLEIFPSYRFDLNARDDGKFNMVFRAQARNGFGNTKIEALLRTFGGIFFQEVTPEYYNLRGSATNILSLARWDPDKRRAYVWLSGPLGNDPKWRYRLGTDLRNENWDVQTSFAGPSTLLGTLNMRREAGTAEITRLIGSRWKWSLGAEVSHRDFRNVFPGTGLTPQLLMQGWQLKQIAQLNAELWRLPERRFTLSSSASSQAGRIWSQPGEPFEKLQASVEAHWLPQPRGDDYETFWRVRSGKTFGQLPFDELYMLGAERDNDLWLRGHVGTRHGRKGSAPLGRDYVLSNFETDKNIYSNGFLTVKLGPFLDSGKVWDRSAALGSHKWLFDTGAQARVRVLGVGVALSYGKDLRSGNNALFATVSH
jgi:tetratricopeptide (TPR) repeat protein